MTVNVGRFEGATRAMGPGLRACLWVRGCSINCAGCITADLIPSEPRELSPVDEVWGWVERAAAHGPLEGVSFSGGEPFEQAKALAELAHRARDRGLSTLAWSGYTRRFLEGPRAPGGAIEFLEELDVLIDGPFVAARTKGALPLRGSTNQVLHLLTPRYRPEDFDQRRLEAAVRQDGSLEVRGVGDYDALRTVLTGLGLVKPRLHSRGDHH